MMLRSLGRMDAPAQRRLVEVALVRKDPAFAVSYPYTEGISALAKCGTFDAEANDWFHIPTWCWKEYKI